MSDKVRVLVVDDSAFARAAISRTLGADSDIEVIGTAKDGLDAVEQTLSLKPDVITLDVSMPRMDGLQALARIMKDRPTPVVMVSALTGENTYATIEALEKGAVDFFLKSSPVRPAGDGTGQSDLLAKVKSAAHARVGPVNGRASARQSPPSKQPPRPFAAGTRVLAIGSSTGGPKALSELLHDIPGDIPAAIAIVQHMPAGFTNSLAHRLNQSAHITVKEAEAGDRLEVGKALLAPGGQHMRFDRSGRVALDTGPTVCGVRPAVDVTIRSLVAAFGASVDAVILTGMGADGTEGAGEIKRAGGSVAVEHESTCVVYGMPKSIIDAGFADAVIPIGSMARRIVEMCRR